MNHDAHLTLVGELAYESEDKIKEAVENVNFKGGINVTGEVHSFPAQTDTAPDGEEVEIPAHVLVFFFIEANNGVDYTDDGNASGLEIDLQWKLKEPFPFAFTNQFEWDVSLAQTQFCEHPEDRHFEVDDSVNGCDKCGGPIIA